MCPDRMTWVTSRLIQHKSCTLLLNSAWKPLARTVKGRLVSGWVMIELAQRWPPFKHHGNEISIKIPPLQECSWVPPIKYMLPHKSWQGKQTKKSQSIIPHELMLNRHETLIAWRNLPRIFRKKKTHESVQCSASVALRIEDNHPPQNGQLGHPSRHLVGWENTTQNTAQDKRIYHLWYIHIYIYLEREIYIYIYSIRHTYMYNVVEFLIFVWKIWNWINWLIIILRKMMKKKPNTWICCYSMYCKMIITSR